VSFSLSGVIAHYVCLLGREHGIDFSEAKAELEAYDPGDRLAALEARVKELEAQNKALHLGAQQRGRVGK
jgi:hypothetical protein